MTINLQTLMLEDDLKMMKDNLQQSKNSNSNGRRPGIVFLGKFPVQQKRNVIRMISYN